MKKFASIFMLLFILTTLIPSHAEAQGSTETETFQPDGNSGWDTYISSLSSTTNYGNETTMIVGVSEGTSNIDSSSATIAYSGTWSTGTDANHYGGSIKYTSQTNAYFAYGAVTTSFEYYASVAGTRGIAEIFIDDVSQGLHDLYSSTPAYQHLVFSVDNLPLGYHTIKVVNTGTKNAASTGYVMVVDYLSISDDVSRGLINWDLSTMPSDAKVVEATLSLFIADSSASNSNTLQAFAINTSWSELTAKYNSPWLALGLGSSDILESPSGTASLSASPSVGDQIDITLTPDDVTNMIRDNYFGLMLRLQSETSDAYEFYTSDYETDPTKRPKLVIEYELDTPPPIVSWQCIAGRLPAPDLSLCPNDSYMSPYYKNSNINGIAATYGDGTWLNPTIHNRAKIICEPYPRCQNDWPIYYRFTYKTRWWDTNYHPEWYNYNDQSPTWRMDVTVPGTTNSFTELISCGHGTGDPDNLESENPTQQCHGVFQGVLLASDLTDVDQSYTFGVTSRLIYYVGYQPAADVQWTLYLSLTPFTNECADTYQIPILDTYTIDPTIETPVGIVGEETPTDYQLYPTVIDEMYMVRINDGPWNDGTNDSYSTDVSLNGTTWTTLENFTLGYTEAVILCYEVDPYYQDLITVYFTAPTETFYIRVNDEPDEFADNTNSTPPLSYTIGIAVLIDSGCSQFTYSPEDLYSTIDVPGTSEYVPVYDPEIPAIIGGDWYGIKVESGTWSDPIPNASSVPRIDMQFNFKVFDPQLVEPPWRILAMGEPLVGCETNDGTMVFVQAPLAEGQILHLRVNDQDFPYNFADNTGTLHVSIYHATNTYTPSGCAVNYEIGGIVANGSVRGDQVNGMPFANSLLTGSELSSSYKLTPGSWYMLQTRDGPWQLEESASSVQGDYQPGVDYYDIQLSTVVPSSSSNWYAPNDWPLAGCVVNIDMIGHQSIYFQVPNNNAADLNQGGAEYYIRVAGAGLLGTGEIGWDLYGVTDSTTVLPPGSSNWQTCYNQYINTSSAELNSDAWIPVQDSGGTMILQYGSTGGGASALIPDEDYWLETSNGPWYDGVDTQWKYAAQISSDGGSTWFSLGESPDVYCAEIDPLGSYERAFFHVDVGQVWKIRVADTETEIFTDNTGTLAYTLHGVNPSNLPGDVTDNQFEVCAPVLIKPVLGIVTFTSTGFSTPTAPTSWDPSDWVPYLGSWFESIGNYIGGLYDSVTQYLGDSFSVLSDYGGGWMSYINRSVTSYFAWCPRHVNILVVAIHKLESKEPLATVREIEDVADNTIVEVKGYDWGSGGEGGGVGDGYEDTSIFSFGGEGGGVGENQNAADNIVEKILPSGGEAFDPWDGGTIVIFGESTGLPSYYSTCNNAVADYLPSRLRDGVCFASAYWKETGAAWWIQLLFDIGTVFLLFGMIKTSVQSLVYMMTGVRPWTKDGAIKVIETVARGDDVIRPVDRWNYRR